MLFPLKSAILMFETYLPLDGFRCFVLRRSNPFPVTQGRIKFQKIQFCISIVFVYKHLNVKTVQLNVKTVLFQTIHFSINTLFQYQKQFYFKQLSLLWVHS